jgi:hypothetical protein
MSKMSEDEKKTIPSNTKRETSSTSRERDLSSTLSRQVNRTQSTEASELVVIDPTEEDSEALKEHDHE